MRFLAKSPSFALLMNGVSYQRNKDNSSLRGALLQEQFGHCAYTEKFLDKLDSVEVEHFNPRLKYQDGYLNYYATLRWANNYKRRQEQRFSQAPFFRSLFFQDHTQLRQRIRYFKGEGGFEGYEPADEQDQEARELIEFLGFNSPDVSHQRKRHLAHLREFFQANSFTSLQKVEYLRANPDKCSFPTALEAEFEIDLSEFYTHP